MEKNVTSDNFQELVSQVLIRHKSILDIITKSQESNARINRAIMKSVTSCGCISINASKQEYNKESLKELKDFLSNHVEGELCDSCKEKIEEEMGDHLFYLASICNALNLDLNDILSKEYNELNTLGIYSLL